MQDAQHIQNIQESRLNVFLTGRELNEFEMLEAEEKIISYILSMGELPKEVELDNFEIVRIDEALNEFEIKALETLMQDDSNYDLSDKDFFDKYILLSSKLKSDDVLSQCVKLDFAHIFAA